MQNRCLHPDIFFNALQQFIFLEDRTKNRNKYIMYPRQVYNNTILSDVNAKTFITTVITTVLGGKCPS